MTERKGILRFEKGVDTKIFLGTIIAALLVILLVAYFFVKASGTTDIPKANQPRPNSRLVLPSPPSRVAFS